MTTVMVTGICGFIGSHLADLLIEEGFKVIGVDNLSSGSRDNLNPKAILCKMDISSPVVRTLFQEHKPKYVFHLAANAKISECTDDPVGTYKTNVLGTLNLLELAREFKVKGFIYSSSSSVYGEVATKTPITEETPTRPISAYGLQKLQAEQIVRLYARVYRVPTISLRYFNVYGTSRQKPNGAYPNVFSAFIRDNKEKGEVTIYGSGKQVRDFIHVLDVAWANREAMALLEEKYPYLVGEVFNIGTGQTTSINTIAKILGLRTVHRGARVGDPSYSCASITKTKRILHFEPQIGLDEGIEILLDTYEK